MRVHLVNASHVSFGVAVITPRWLFVLAAATRAPMATPCWSTRRSIRSNPPRAAGDVVGIGIHTATRCAATKWQGRTRARRVGGLRRHPCHAVPDEPHQMGSATAW